MAATGYCDLRAAARWIGPAYVPGWQKEGADEFAPSAAEDMAELRAIAEMSDTALRKATRIWHQSIEQAAATERTARQEAGAPPSGIKEALPKLRQQIAESIASERAARQDGERDRAAKLRKYRARLKKLLASLETAATTANAASPRGGRYTRDELDQTRMRLMDEAAERHAERLAARLRWQTAVALLRNQAFRGTVLTVALLPDGSTIPLSAEECRACWPPPGGTRTLVVHDGFTLPATILVREADIDRVWPRVKGALQDGDEVPPPIADVSADRLPRGWYIGDLEAFIAGLKNLRGRKPEWIAQQFRSQHPNKAKLPQARSIAVQAEPICERVVTERAKAAVANRTQPR